MVEEGEYVLGVDRDEIERLRFQHYAWIEQAYALWRRAGIRAGERVLDLGSGPGFTSFELARLVGRDGRVIARDRSEAFLRYLAVERERHGLAQIETSLGPVEELDLAPGSLDAAYARWLLCWVPDAGAVVASVARALRPGGVLALQEYLDWGGMKLLPHSAAFERMRAACMRSWEEARATIDIGERVPELARRCGLVLEHFRPIARLGRVGSLEWRWMGEFYRSYLPKLVARGLYDQHSLEAFLAEWNAREREDAGWAYAPTMVEAVLRKP